MGKAGLLGKSSLQRRRGGAEEENQVQEFISKKRLPQLCALCVSAVKI
jgi:hypothetical protein